MSITTEKAEQHPKGGLCTKHTVDNTVDLASTPGKWVFVSTADVGVNLIVASGGAKVELTSSLPAECQAGSAIAFAWTPGNQTGAGNLSAVISGATAVRLVPTAAGTVASMFVRSA